ncbi:MAG: DUF2497 domain-containing protein [Holosporales bacterium]|jgi:cell pole-organizing protein PopZ|nr:DUF2497 domain-containing protein [Holosporales bacterium]
MQKRAEEGDIEEILSSIREIMASENLDAHKTPEDVLLLTDIVPEDRSADADSERGVQASDKGHVTEKAEKSASAQMESKDTESFLSLIEKNADNLQFSENAGIAHPKDSANIFRREETTRNAEISMRREKECDSEDAATPGRSSTDVGLDMASLGSSSEAASSVNDRPSSKLSTKTQNSALSSLNRLRQTIEQKRSILPNESNPLEDLVRRALHPLLKEWLEKYLPDIVETVVTREVQVLTKKLTAQD